jgi:hypothetical protein
VPLRSGRTLHHDVEGRWGAGTVLLRAAKPGTGIIAGGPMRAVFETLGMHDVVAKSMGSSNPYNMVRATFDALKSQMHPKDVAAAARHQVFHLAGAPRLAVAPKNKERYHGKKAAKKAATGKTLTVEQIGSPIRRPRNSARRWSVWA